MNALCATMLSRFRGVDARQVRRCIARTLAMAIGAACTLSPATGVRAGDPIRPMGGGCDTTFAFTGPGAVLVEGTCHLLHLGLASTHATQLVIPQPDGSLLITNVATYTAANGDELFANFVGTGTLTATGISFSGTETYSGGTGRFASAWGSCALAGTAQFTSATAGVGEFSGRGSISY